MDSTTIESILQLPIFEAGDNSGFSISAMLLESAAVRRIPKDDLLAALSDMERDGLLRSEQTYYYSTTNGKIALRKLLARKGLTTAPVADQNRYELADLVLAIAAHDNVEHGVQMSFPTRQMMSVYLHEFDAAAVAVAVDRLIEAGHADPYEFGLLEGVAINGEGLQHYQEEVCQRLNLEPRQGILRLAEPVELDDRFARLGLEQALVENLQQRWREMGICAENGAYLATIILLGSILEGVLLARLQQRITDAMRSPLAPKERGSKTVKTLTDWTLQEYISVSADIGLLPRSVEKHVHELRDTRNLVHPNKQWASGISVDQPLYRISRQVADTVIDGLVML